jgi:hypothetical protein
MTAPKGPTPAEARTCRPFWAAGLGRARLWLAALVLLAAGLAGGAPQARLHTPVPGGAVLERAAGDLAVLRQSEAPALKRRMAADDRAGGPDDPGAAPAPRQRMEAPAGSATSRALASPAPHRPGLRLRPEARAPPAA